MKIAANEAKAFVNAVFALVDAGEISEEMEQDLHKWMDALAPQIKSAGGLAEGDSIELPPQFISLWRKCQQSKAYPPNLDTLLLQAEDKGRRLRGNVPAYTPFNVKPETTMQTSSSFLQEFGRLTGPTKRTLETLESLRRGGTDALIDRGVRSAFAALRSERRAALGDPVAKLLDASDERRELWEAIGRKLTRGVVTTEQAGLLQKAFVQGVDKVFTPGITPSDDFGGGMFLAAAVSEDVLYASYQYGAWKDLGWRILSGARMKYVKITQAAQAVFITPTQQGKVTIPVDVFTAGDQVCELANTIALLVEMSLELVQDGSVVLSEAVLRAISEGHSKAVDYACFQGNGNDDPLNGTQTGIFVDTNIPSAPAANGGTNIGALVRDDFIAAVAAVAPSALTRDPRWFISPALLPKLLKLRDGQGPKYLLRTPAQTEGEWELVGFPVTWTIQAPANDVAGQKVAAFGAPDGYLVALQDKMEILASDHPRFSAAVRQMRLANRGRVETRESTWLATLALAKQ